MVYNKLICQTASNLAKNVYLVVYFNNIYTLQLMTDRA